MIFAKNDEAERSKLWRATMLVSSALIIIIAIYLLTKLFTTNPLEGNWIDEDGSYKMSIRSNGVASVQVGEVGKGSDIDVAMGYTLDREQKKISISAKDEDLKTLSEKSDGKFSQEELQSAIDQMESTFTYSVDDDQLTLTECDYGDQMIFMKN